MKLNPMKTRTAGMPTAGVKFTKAEIGHADGIAVMMRGVDSGVLSTISDALAHQAMRLEAAVEWTEGESERQRREQHEQTLIVYRAVQSAILAKFTG